MTGISLAAKPFDVGFGILRFNSSMPGFILILILLIFLHFLGDFAFQSNYMAQGKNFKNQNNDKSMTVYLYLAHGFIQGGLILIFFPAMVLIIIFEIISHITIDYLKCAKYYEIHVDQSIHILLRFIYAIIIFWRLI